MNELTELEIRSGSEADTTAVMKDIEALHGVASAFMKSQVLLVANHYDLFTKLADRRLAAEEIAGLLKTDPRATRMLLDALVGLDYLEKRNGVYGNSAVAKRLLIRGSEFYQGDSLRHRYRLWFTWSALRNVLKTGAPPESLVTEYSETEEQRTRDFILSMANSGRLRAEQLADHFDIRGAKRLLDLGGGPGSYACALARRHPALRAVVYDLPEVCAITDEQIAGAGLSESVTTRSGDFLTDDLGAGYDLILVSNIIHSYSPEQNRHIVSKCFEALAPGGRIAVKDFFMNADRSGPMFSLLFAINMLVNTTAGDVYTFDQMEKILIETGFIAPNRIPFTEQSWLIVGEKKRGGL